MLIVNMIVPHSLRNIFLYIYLFLEICVKNAVLLETPPIACIKLVNSSVFIIFFFNSRCSYKFLAGLSNTFTSDNWLPTSDIMIQQNVRDTDYLSL